MELKKIIFGCYRQLIFEICLMLEVTGVGSSYTRKHTLGLADKRFKIFFDLSHSVRKLYKERSDFFQKMI